MCSSIGCGGTGKAIVTRLTESRARIALRPISDVGQLNVAQSI